MHPKLNTHDNVLAVLEKGLRRPTPNAAESIALHVDCMDHKGTYFENGYGRIGNRRAHTAAFAAAHNLDYEDLGGFQVLHDCDRKACCNPAHLRLATNTESVEDKLARNRQARMRGELSGKAVLTTEQVAAIRQEYVRGSRTQGGRALAAMYGVAESTISYIVNGVRRQYG